MITPDELWKRSQSDLEIGVSNGMINMWIRPARVAEIREVGEDRAIALITSLTPYHLSMLENKFYAQIKDAFDRITGKKFELQFALRHQVEKGKEKDSGQPQQQTPENTAPLFAQQPPPTQIPQQLTPADSFFKSTLHRAGLREDYTFETFAVSSSNEMAHAAASAVSQSPGTAYNPLFLYGGVGVGKTHLMQAIGNNVLRKNPDTSILYITGEQFTNDIVAAIQQKKTIQLKHRLRNFKMLLVDDVQFMAGKMTVQEEFFHTFNAIMPAGGQIILTSDRPPHEINLLEDRLKSRFEAGLIVDIQQPTFELRTAILLIKAKKMGLEIPMDVAQRIASAVESTRKLEGILAQIHSSYTLFRRPITPELAEEILGKTEQAPFPKNTIKPAEVVKTVSTQFHFSVNQLKGPSRAKPLVTARHIAMYVLHKDLGITNEEVGHIFNGRDHSSVMHAVEKISQLIESDEFIRTNLNAIKTSLSFSTL